MNFLFQILQQQGTQTGGNPGISSLIFLVLIIVVFYFFMIRPQVKKQKEMTNYRNALKKGDKVSTTGGIYGKITDVKEKTVTLEIADNVLVRVDKTAVTPDPTASDQLQKS
ncbi:MAG: preprotein translocase subunit YajC [Bacteroidales bacterium]|nr:preprotein translocase subunit YajC [Bacteroidales bacterium]MBN2698471.1 preprotein translocase subunit YajC [Bacteroidales bacterium]